MSTNVLKAPKIAWPTLFLFAFNALLWCANLALAFFTDISPLLTFAIAFICAFISFTPMHDAAHRSVARQGFINAFVGRVCATMLTAPFVAFRYVHLRHHAYTNEKEDDPDMYSGTGPWPLLPLKWASQDLHYYVFYISKWNERPLREKLELPVVFLCMGVVFYSLYAAGALGALLFAWVLPARLAIASLSFAFDYLPHKPHLVAAKENRFAATVIRPSRWLTPVLLYQNYHLIHHLYPGVPFYRYGSVWFRKTEQLLDKGALARSAFGREITREEVLADKRVVSI